MERIYYVFDITEKHFILRCASYSFSDDEEIMSATNDILCNDSYNLIVGEYVKFENEKVDKKDSKYIVSGVPNIYHNEITDDDRNEYDKEFELSIKAYIDNDVEGIERWQNYLRTYEDKFMRFEKIER